MTEKTLFPFVILIFVALIGPHPAFAQLKPVKQLNVDKYLGVWNEVARFPVFYQRGCVDSQAIYERIDQENLSITNKCTRNGKTTTISGRAINNGIGKFQVSISRFLPFKAEYWVLWVDDRYQTAVVGVPTGNRGWILSRSKKLTAAHRETVLRVLTQNGYNPDQLIWN